MSNPKENQLNIPNFFETLAKIIGDRDGLEIKVVSIKKKPVEIGA